jgi:penicillin-insensitive murein endopeptidase
MVVRRIAALVVLGLASTSCAQLGLVSDGTSVSVGRTNAGMMLDPARIPDDGDGFWAPPIWRQRGARYGVEELVDLIAAVGRSVSAQYPGSRLGVADLSRGRGGGAEHHRSHQSGRDVDLVLFATDAAGTPIASDTMHVFDDDGHGRRAPVRLDIPRTWAVVRALVTSTEAEVQRIFFYEPLALRVLDYARELGESELILERARAVLRQPSDSARHDDHMHVRIFCPAADVAYGCVDAGDLDVQGKSLPRMAALSAEQRAALQSPMPAMLALVGWTALR